MPKSNLPCGKDTPIIKPAAIKGAGVCLRLLKYIKRVDIMQMLLLLRGFVVLGVMLMHTTWFFSQPHSETWTTISSMLLDIISLFAVPLILFISGYLFISRHRHADRYGLSFCRKMFLSVLSPYLLFSLLYLAGACFFNGEKYSVSEIISLIFTGSAAVHLVFFRALFGYFVVYPVIVKCFTYCQHHKKMLYYFAAVIFLQMVWKSLNNMENLGAAMENILLATTFLRYITYFSFGMAAYIHRCLILRWIGRHYGLLNLLLLVFIPAVAGCWFAKYYLHSYRILEFICFPLNLFLYSILIAMLFYHANAWLHQHSFHKQMFIYLGNYSFGIFLLHIIFMYCGVKILTLLHITPADFSFYPLLFILMLSMSVSAMELLVRLPWHEYIVGKISKLHFFCGGQKQSE